jgi:hypothetical protein
MIRILKQAATILAMVTIVYLVLLFAMVMEAKSQQPQFLLPRPGEVYSDRIPFVAILKLPRLAAYSLSVDTLQMINVNTSTLIEPRLTEYMASVYTVDDILVCFGTVGDEGWHEGEHTFRFFALDSNHTSVVTSRTVTYRRSQEPYVYYKDFKIIHDTIAPLTRHITRDTIAVHEGWNMIGGLSYKVPVDSILCSVKVSPFYGFNGAYIPANELQSGAGYWVKAEGKGVLIVASRWY